MASDQDSGVSADEPCCCRSGKRVADCHPEFVHAADQELVFQAIERGLAGFDGLRGALPKGYPRRGSARVGPLNSLTFRWLRASRYAQVLNVHQLLLMLGKADSPNAAKSSAGFLNVIERFIREFADTPRMHTVLKPLWQQAWDREPHFWSVLAHCHMALALKYGGHEVIRFEAPTGFQNTTADIFFRSADGLEVLQDIEMWNAPDDVTFESLSSRLHTRAERKAASKFSRLPEHTVAVVSQVVIPNASVLKVLKTHQDAVMTPFQITPRIFAELAAIPAVAHHDGGQYSHDFLTFRSKLRPLHPSL